MPLDGKGCGNDTREESVFGIEGAEESVVWTEEFGGCWIMTISKPLTNGNSFVWTRSIKGHPLHDHPKQIIQFYVNDFNEQFNEANANGR